VGVPEGEGCGVVVGFCADATVPAEPVLAADAASGGCAAAEPPAASPQAARPPLPPARSDGLQPAELPKLRNPAAGGPVITCGFVRA